MTLDNLYTHSDRHFELKKNYSKLDDVRNFLCECFCGLVVVALFLAV